MTITEEETKLVNVYVDLTGPGEDVAQFPSVDTDSVMIPTLGGSETPYPQTFDFSLNCNYEN
ncbi:hypothetical protein C9439_07285 [archaeon SCG-AAA382B04]|nr:hypothetical protein C9439_07285 [archaeon SCG-AAA382B04]